MPESTDRDAVVTYRGHTDDDLPFIFSTFLKGLRHGNPHFELIPGDLYFKCYHAAIEALLSTPGVYVNIACLKEDPSTILGYAIFKGDRLDWVFIKRRWRKIGLARALIPTTVTSVSHMTEVGKILLPKLPGVIFDPFNLP